MSCLLFKNMWEIISGKRIELLRQLIESYFQKKCAIRWKMEEKILNIYLMVRYYLLKDEFPNKLNSSYRVMLENIEILNNLNMG